MIEVSIIGYGNLAKALALRLIKLGQYHIRVSAPSLTPGQTAEGIQTQQDNLAILDSTTQIIILAVKPAKMPEILQECSQAFPKNSLLISLAAGISLAVLNKHCHKEQAIIRAMPNVAALVGQSATALLANDKVSPDKKIQAEILFQTIGISEWVYSDEDINQFTALAGSGPAYVFLFMESLIDAAINSGMAENLAKEFTFQTLQGALTLAEHSPLSLRALREQVTSPQGTTAAALKSLADDDFHGIIGRALNSALQRARALSSVED